MIRAGLIKCATGEDRHRVPGGEDAPRHGARPSGPRTRQWSPTSPIRWRRSNSTSSSRRGSIRPGSCISHVGGGDGWRDRLLGALRRGANVSVDMISSVSSPTSSGIEVVRTALDAGYLGPADARSRRTDRAERPGDDLRDRAERFRIHPAGVHAEACGPPPACPMQMLARSSRPTAALPLRASDEQPAPEGPRRIDGRAERGPPSGRHAVQGGPNRSVEVRARERLQDQ